MDNLFSPYIVVRQEIDTQCNTLHSTHQPHTSCKKGCDQCCINFSVLPIEFFNIVHELKQKSVVLNINNTDQCIFLNQGVCQIYEHRPSICRSHGLPILNMDSEGENMELSFCPLNFKNVEIDYFTLENGFQQDTFNSKLYMANINFLKQSKYNYSENVLIPLRKISEFI